MIGNNKEARRYSVVFICVVLLILSFTISLGLGRAFTLGDIWTHVSGVLRGDQGTNSAYISIVLLKIRIPRILAAICVGMSLATAGASYQGLFQNPMVSPDILGASAGAGLGAAIAILMGAGAIGVQLLSFACGIMAVGLTYAVSLSVGGKQKTVLMLVLSGMVTGSLMTACVSITKYLADTDDKLPAITFWLMGSLASVTQNDSMLLFLLFLAGGIPLFCLRWKLNVLSCGEEEAQSMGINTRRMQVAVIACSTMLSAASVSIAGMIGWVGLAVPHIARMLVGSNYKSLLPVSALIGGIFLLIADDMARCLTTAEIPLGILTSLCGAPFFLYLLLRTNKLWSA
ncbi:MAG: iron ABC transporter permease [Clostridiales bacterium]|nr:iron ABC transporter permease [Clostridiales bacterium]